MPDPWLDKNNPKTPASGERRASPRQKSHAEAWADPGGMAPAIPCKVIDISSAGAKLAFPPGSNLPDTFILRAGNTKRSAHVVWRRKDEIGVEFQRVTQHYRESGRLPEAEGDPK